MYALDAYERTYLYDDMEVPNTLGTGYGCHRAGFEVTYGTAHRLTKVSLGAVALWQ